MARVMIRLENEERDALVQLALNEKRDPRDQASLLIRKALERRGFLRDSQNQLARDAARGVGESAAA